MKAYTEYLLAVLLVGLLAAIYAFMGARVFWFAGCLGGIWFFIMLVLLSRPPGIPEFVSEEIGSDEQYVVRKDVIPKLPWIQRLRIALAAACGSCLLLWISLAALGG